MSAVERAGLSVLRRLDPELAHGAALAALRAGVAPGCGVSPSARIGTRLFGRDIPNPVGVAAGFDKNAEALAPLLRAGFGFVEVGAVTPRPQPGNPRPRLFRLSEDRAAINRFGFNNDGLEAMAARLALPRPPGLVGVNVGANKDSADRARDYVAAIARLRGLCDFFTVNVSSPNTAGLRDMQGREALDALLADCVAAAHGAPVALKIAPDLEPAEIDAAAEIALARGAAAIIATNTTTARDGLRSARRGEAGGLSGRPLFARSTEALLRLRRGCGDRIALIGVGGVEDAATAYAKIRAGASALQLYTALIYGGLSLVGRICAGLDAALARDGFSTLAEAVGVDA